MLRRRPRREPLSTAHSPKPTLSRLCDHRRHDVSKERSGDGRVAVEQVKLDPASGAAAEHLLTWDTSASQAA